MPPGVGHLQVPEEIVFVDRAIVGQGGCLRGPRDYRFDWDFIFQDVGQLAFRIILGAPLEKIVHRRFRQPPC